MACPICHSGEYYQEEYYGYEESRPRKRYFSWTNDPLKTELGLAGENYKGVNFIDNQHIYELQSARSQQEDSVGIPYYNRTQFSWLYPFQTSLKIPNKKHINELRESTEKILHHLGFTLEQYFNYEINANDDGQYYIGQYYGTYKYGEKVADKTEWENIDRTTGKPHLPSTIKIRAIHIEELRHQIPIIEEILAPPLIIEPSVISFNLRCLTEPEIKVSSYVGNENVTGETMWMLGYGGNELVELDEAWGQEEITIRPKDKVGNSSLSANYDWYGIPLSNSVLIHVVRAVAYEGDNLTSTTGAQWDGSATGCDGSIINVQYKIDRITGIFDGLEFSIPMGGFVINNYYSDNKGNRLEEQPIISSSYPYPEYPTPPNPTGYYTERVSSYTLEPIPLENNYKVSGEAGGWIIRRFYYELVDYNKDGVMDTWVIRYSVIDSGGNFSLGFSYDPTLE